MNLDDKDDEEEDSDDLSLDGTEKKKDKGIIFNSPITQEKKTPMSKNKEDAII